MNLPAWSELPSFDINSALRGEACVHTVDYHMATRKGLRPKPSTDCRVINAPHPGWMIWSGEWLVYESLDEMSSDYKMLPFRTLDGVEK